MDDTIKIKYADSYTEVWTKRGSDDIAPGGSKTSKVEEGWREELNTSSFIDCQDTYDKW